MPVSTCAIIMADTRLPELHRWSDRSVNSSAAQCCPLGHGMSCSGCTCTDSSDVGYFTRNVLLNALAAEAMGCAFYLFHCSLLLSEVFTGETNTARWCKVAAINKLLDASTRRGDSASHLQHFMFIDSDAVIQPAMNISLGVFSQVLKSTRPLVKPATLSASDWRSEHEVAPLQLSGAALITSSGHSCGLNASGSTSGASTIINKHCSCVMLWQTSAEARWLARRWMGTFHIVANMSNTMFNDQLGLNYVARYLQQTATASVRKLPVRNTPRRQISSVPGVDSMEALVSTVFVDDSFTYGTRWPEAAKDSKLRMHPDADVSPTYARCRLIHDLNDAALRSSLSLPEGASLITHRKEKACSNARELGLRLGLGQRSSLPTMLHKLLSTPERFIREVDILATVQAHASEWSGSDNVNLRSNAISVELF